MPNPRFEPLTLSQEEWNLTLAVASDPDPLPSGARAAAVSKIVRECEAQAQAAASLRQRLEDWQLKFATSEVLTLDIIRERDELRARVSGALDDEGKAHILIAEARRCIEDGKFQAALRKLTALDGFVSAAQTAAELRHRASQAEAALEEMRKQWDGFESWLQDEIEASKSVPFDRGVKARRILAELQRRRSPTGQEEKERG